MKIFLLKITLSVLFVLAPISASPVFARDFIIRDVTNANNVFFGVIGATGRVGIGTSTPTQKLTVVGTIESTTGGVKYPRRSDPNRGLSWLFSNRNRWQCLLRCLWLPFGFKRLCFPGTLAIGTSTTTGFPANGLFVVGNVGIGTTGPSRKLTVSEARTLICLSSLYLRGRNLLLALMRMVLLFMIRPVPHTEWLLTRTATSASDDESGRHPPCFQRLFVQRSFCRCLCHRYGGKVGIGTITRHPP